jgi:uncharacterized protein YcfJ
MNKSLMTGIGIGVVVAAAAGAVASLSMKGPTQPAVAVEQLAPEALAQTGAPATPMAEAVDGNAADGRATTFPAAGDVRLPAYDVDTREPQPRGRCRPARLRSRRRRHAGGRD